MHRLLTVIVISIFTLGAKAQFQGLIVNEFSQGDQGSREYIELLVLGNRTCTDSTADLRGWIFDDQNGWYGAGSITPGHYRFKNVTSWSAVPFGSIILFYNSASGEKNLSITQADDLTDANHDYVYVLPINSSNFIEENNLEPLVGSGTAYAYPLPTATAGYFGASNVWMGNIALNNNGDVISTVSPSDRTTAFFSVAYGFAINPGFHAASVSVGNVNAGRNCYLAGSSYNVAGAWLLGNADPVLGAVNETPALPNGGANTSWILAMRQQVTTPPAPVVSILQPNCNNSAGSIQIVSPVGPGYSYSKDGSTYSPFNTVFTNLAPGSYPVTAMISGCVSTVTNVVINTAPTTPSIPLTTLTQPDCIIPTGTITVSSPAGPGLSYSIGGSYQASTVFTGVASGLYGVTAKNSDGCISGAGIVTIDPPPPVPAAPAVNISSQPSCSNPVGSITIAAPSGMNYSINGIDYSNTTGAFTSLAPGTYHVTVKNSYGCVSPATSIVIPTPAQMPATPVVTVGQPSCTASAGTIIINSPAGAGLLYSIDGSNYSTQTVFNSLAPGNYQVTVQNGGCTSAVVTVVINPQPAVPPAPVLNLVQPSCNTSTGTINISAPAGMNYSIDGMDYSNSSGVFSNLNPGNYNITAQNSSGCISLPSGAVISPQPATPLASVNSPAICPGSSAVITASVSPPGSYSYVWSVPAGEVNPGNVASFTAATAGTYSVIVTNQGNCSATASGILSFTASGVVSADDKNVCQNATVQLTGQPAGGIWNGVAVTGSVFSAVSLNPGTYPVSYTYSSGGCSGTATATITVAALPAMPVTTVIQPDCSIGTGSITVTSPTGAGFNYSLNGAGYTSNPIFANLAPAAYTVSVQNSAGCISAANIVVDAPPSIPSAPIVSVTQPVCAGNAGTITINSPGTGLTYSIDGIYYQINSVFTGLAPASYFVTVKNSSGCISSPATAIINTPAPLPSPPVVNIVQPNCIDPTGTLQILSPTGSNFLYSINGSSYQASLNFTGLVPGSYPVTVKDNNGCISPATPAMINASPAAPAAPVVTIIQPSCTTSTGSITINSPAGSGYSYSVDGLNYTASAIFGSLVPGSYTVSVKNSNGCVSDTVVMINQAQTNFTLGINGPAGAVLCPMATGFVPTIGAVPSVNGNYSYVWTVPAGISNPGNVQTFAVNTAGTYTVTATNASGCSATSSITLNMAVPVSPSAADDKQVCSNSSVSLTAQLPGGTWTGNHVTGSSFDATGVAPGSYQVYYMHPVNSYCVFSVANITVAPIPAAPAVTVSDHCDGSSSLTASNFTGTLLWNNGANGSTINVTVPGSYSVVQVLNGCASPPGTGTATPVSTQIQSQTISGCGSAQYNGNQYVTSTVVSDTLRSINGCDSIIQIVTIIVNQSSTGNITVCRPAGQTYDFNGKQLTVSGHYTDTLVAANGCDSIIHLQLVIATTVTSSLSGCEAVWYGGNNYTSSTSVSQVIPSVITGCDSLIRIVNIIVNPKPVIEPLNNQMICKGDSIKLSAFANGAAIHWQGFGAGSTITVFPAISTTYHAIATNTAGCSDTVSVMVGINSFDIQVAVLNNTVVSGSTVQLQSTSSSPYEVLSWSPATLFPDQQATTQTFIIDSTVNIMVIARSAQGCRDTGLVTVIVAPVDDIYIPNAFTPNGDGRNDLFKVLGGQIQSLDLKIFNRWGELIFTTKERSKGWDGNYNGKGQPGAVYVYLVEILLKNGKKVTRKGTVTLIR